MRPCPIARRRSRRPAIRSCSCECPPASSTGPEASGSFSPAATAFASSRPTAPIRAGCRDGCFDRLPVGLRGLAPTSSARPTAAISRPFAETSPAPHALGTRWSQEETNSVIDATALQLIIPIAGIAAILFALYLGRDVLSRDVGPTEMQDVAGTIYEGAVAFIRRQYTTIAALAIVGGVVIGVVIAIFETREVADTSIFGTELGIRTGVAFLVGAACSMASGIIGMFISVKANVRTASAARRSLVEAVQVAMRGGAVSGFLVVALSLLGVYLVFVASGGLGHPEQAPFLIVGYGFGASFVALFAQLGGGIYTKAADVGSDLVGKVEAGIPEDDPRNAAVVADLVGDNVGDCAGRGADLFESMSAENIGAMILGVAIYKVTGDLQWVVFPLVLRSFGIFATIAGLTSVPLFAREDGRQDPMTPLDYGYYIVSALSVIGLFIATIVMLGHEWYWFFFCGLIGIGTGIAFVYITQYYTSGGWRPVP